MVVKMTGLFKCSSPGLCIHLVQKERAFGSRKFIVFYWNLR